jgi:hypothetical protein
MSSRAWDVYLTRHNGWRVEREHLTTVFYDRDCDEAWVRDGLVNHDGYPSDIELVGEGYKECPTCDEKSDEDTWIWSEEYQQNLCRSCSEPEDIEKHENELVTA